MPKILLVEDDLTFSRLLEGFLQKHGFQVDVKKTVAEGILAVDVGSYEIMLLDYRLPDGTGLDVLNAARKKGLNFPTVVMTSFNDVRTAVKAIRSGAFDYITKPVNPEELLMIIQESMDRGKQKTDEGRPERGFIKGRSGESDKLYDYISLVAPTDMSVIIQGESGTGKEHVARSIHDQSKRASKPFIALDCGALSGELAASEFFGHVKGAFTGAFDDKKGQFESANGGTIFLDEVGNLNYAVQVKLLRAVQERLIQPVGSTKIIPVDVRILTATNEDLLSNVNRGDFREDLYHRLNEFKIQLPPLRERGKDLLIFIEHFIGLANSELGRNVKSLSPEVMEVFQAYDWPGNLRELKNVVKRVVLLSSDEFVKIEALPEEMIFSVNKPKVSTGSSDIKAVNEANEKALIAATLAQVKYNKSLAAKLLNIDRKTLYSKIDKYNIK
ncbi:MAG: sigma-54-dependent transcriptional regulator [Daejeonella sp.]